MKRILDWLIGRRLARLQAQQQALDRVLAVVELSMDGKVLDANPNFLRLMGYTLDEVRGRHHRSFVDAAYAESPEYQQFWEDLRQGRFKAAQFRRLARDGREVWIQASYNPVLDRRGRPRSIIKYASDITAQKQRDDDFRAQITAIDRVMAVIEFAPDGTILNANANFLATMGYRLEEIRGRHHQIFVDPDDARSDEYRRFWQRLAAGETDAGVYARYGKDRREVWIQASYNPVIGSDGRVSRIIKYATDITAQKRRDADFASQIDAIGRVMAIIEFAPDGTVLDANDNFLRTMACRMDDIRGRHHRMFVDAATAASPAYAAFWNRLASGQFDAGRYRRVGGDGREVWIQASYNPIVDSRGQTYKIVKYATDITEQMRISEQMEQLIARLERSADVMRTAVQQIASGNQDLAQRTRAQAEALRETTEAMAQMTGAVRNAGESAHMADELSTSAANVAARGGVVMHGVVQTMEAISDTSKRIGELVTVIDGIAFQTNLLALNAAVEAARAGEHGRGFAVVATEVRELAQRCAQASREIHQLVAEARERVGAGSEGVRAAGATMQDIVDSVGRVSGLISSIAAVSREQTSDILALNRNLVAIDSSTQQNAQLVKDIRASTQALEDQVESLNALFVDHAHSENGPAKASAVAPMPRLRSGTRV